MPPELLDNEQLLFVVKELRERPRCSKCGQGFLRATDVVGGKLLLECSSRSCLAHSEYVLPLLARKLVYLDPNVVSNIARGRFAPFRVLYDALQRAIDANVIACISSNIAVAEIELARDAEAILEVTNRLATASVRPDIEVQDSQIYRAFGRFRRNESPILETRPPREDAFDEDLNAWRSLITISSRFPTRNEEIDRRRADKISSQEILRTYYEKYADQRLTLDDIAALENEGFCRRASRDLWLVRRMAYALERDEGMNYEAAMLRARQFFDSKHARLLPAAVINGRLHAALALACRMRDPRWPEEGDSYDIEHLSTYIPYVDVLITDHFMAGIANQRNVRVAADFGARVQPLGGREIDAFVEWLTNLISTSPTAELSTAVYDAIDAGGYLQDFVDSASAMVAR